MSADILLSKLHKVRKTGQGKWMACCPAHDDSSASLSIRELDDGRVLVHCFAQCSTHDVLEAVGLEIADLMPERLPGHNKPVPHPFPARDALEMLVLECIFLQLCALRLSKAQPLAQSDLERLYISANRFKSAADAVGGGRYECD